MERLLPAEEACAFAEDVQWLEGWNNLTYLMNGWDDSQQHSIYSCMIAEVSEFPVVLALEELTGIWGTADNLVDVANKAIAKKSIDPKAIVAVCTDNPTTMLAFHQKWTNQHSWILVCFITLYSIGFSGEFYSRPFTASCTVSI